MVITFTGNIIYDSCLNDENGLYTLEDNSIDISIYDPPFNAKKDYGVYKDNLKEKDYIKFMMTVLEECKRISRRGVGVYVDSWRFKLFWQLKFPDAFPIIIKKRCHTFANKINLLTKFHVILTNAYALNIKPKSTDIWDVTVITDGYICKEKRYDHPAQTGKEPILKFLRLFSEEGETVLEPFIGSGSIIECCVQLNRNWFGYELNEDYRSIIEGRIKDMELMVNNKNMVNSLF